MIKLKINFILFIMLIMGFVSINFSHKVYAEEDYNSQIQIENKENSAILNRIDWEGFFLICNSISDIIEDNSISFEYKKEKYRKVKPYFLEIKKILIAIMLRNTMIILLD